MQINNRTLGLLPFELQVEIAENIHRKDLAPSDIEKIRRLCEAVLAREAKERQQAGLRKGAKSPCANSFANGGRTTDKIGKLAGVSGRTIEKIAAVVEAAEREPERFGSLVEEMDRQKSVDGAYRKLKQARDEERVLALAPIKGRFRTLILDVPWAYEDRIAGRVHGGYARMTMPELLVLPVAQWAEENAHLYLWTTNSFIGEACDLTTAWGFGRKTVLTWIKPKIGLGKYFRNSTEHVIFAVRGDLSTRAHDIPTHFEAPVGDHSEKPERFYEIVRCASYPPYGEAFQGRPRTDFANLYARPPSG
jgi:N6-adenosine-specific RNA methylase IME4